MNELHRARLGSRPNRPAILAVSVLMALALGLLTLGLLAMGMLAGCEGGGPAGPPDLTRPTVSISWPPDGGETSSVAEIVRVEASDSVGVTRVEIKVDAALIATLTAPPYEALWLTAALTTGSPHTITAEARDAAGNLATTHVRVEVGMREIVAITTNPEADLAPCWAPDGFRLAVSSYLAGNQEIRVLDLVGVELGIVATHPARDATPAWSPDGLRIAFASQRDGNWDLYSAPPAGGAPVVRLTQTLGDDQNPTWSPDGAWLAFDSNRSEPRGIWRTSASGDSAQAVDVSMTAAKEPAYSSRGDLVYASARRANFDLWLLAPTERLPESITSYALADYDPAWDPTGRYVAYVTEQFGNPELMIVSRDGGTPVRLTNQFGADDGPSWSPDGRAIALSSERGGNRDIWIIR